MSTDYSNMKVKMYIYARALHISNVFELYKLGAHVITYISIMQYSSHTEASLESGIITVF